MKEAFFPTRARRARVRRPLPFGSLAALVLAGQLGAAWAEAPRLSESEAIRGALSRPAWLEVQRARLGEAEGAAAAAALPPNPVLAYGRERTGTVGGDATERTITLSQTFDVSGRRALRRDAASERLDATRLDGQDRQLSAIADVRRVFAETLHRERSEAAIDRWLQRITVAAEVAGQLARAGEASGYDRRRIEREAQTARARLAAARADAARSRERLTVLAGKQPEDALQVVGDLLPEAAPALADSETTLGRRPDLASLETRAKAFEHERQAAGRGWIPDLTLGIGQKRVTEPGHSDDGVLVGVSVSLPLFDRGQADARKSAAQAQALRAEHAMALAGAAAELRGAWQQAGALRQAAEAFRRESLPGSRELSHIAEAAYRAGEASLLELLDAYRAELDAETTELDLALCARLARIELDHLSGAALHE